MKVLLLWLGLGLMAAGSDTAVLVKVLDVQRQPVVQDVEVHLWLYRIMPDGSAVPEWEGTCVTQQGECEISVPSDAPRDQAGFLRGYIEVSGAEGRRSVIWPSGQRMEIGIMIAGGRIKRPSCGPYDGQNVPVPATSSSTSAARRVGPLYFVIAVLPILLAGVYVLWIRKKG